MQQDNSEMETSHEKEYISNNNYNNYRDLHHFAGLGNSYRCKYSKI